MAKPNLQEMNILPASPKLDVSRLASIFDSRSTSYKFLLFKSILDGVSKGNTELHFNELALRAISYAWYSIHYYKLSLGYSDRMTKWVGDLDGAMENHLLTDQNAYHKIYEALAEINKDSSSPIHSALKTYFNAYSEFVPYRLITPWFTQELQGKKDNEKNRIIFELSNDDNFQSLYKLSREDEKGLVLTISDDWREYLQTNEAILRGWWKFNYILYLQKNNPTILSIATKLDPPISRNMDKAKKLFKAFYKGKIANCFYSGEELDVISHDHYFPWSFLGDDPIYNFVPSKKEVNSSKSNNIPHESYFVKLIEFQYEIFSFMRSNESYDSLLSYYQNDLHIDLKDSMEEFAHKFKEFYKPLMLTAKNQGFSMNWKYKNY